MSVTTAHELQLTVLLSDEESADAVPHAPGVKVLKRPNPEVAGRGKNLFVLASATGLPEVAAFVTAANQRHQLRVLFVREDADPSWLPQLLERASLRTLRNTLLHSGGAMPRRVLMAWRHGAQHALIANASVADDLLFVLSCALEPFELTFGQSAALRRVPKSERANFRISPSGSYIHWPRPDVHLDLDAIRATIDPAWKEYASAQRIAHDRRYGHAISAVRKRLGLRQSDIAGLSARQVRRIENGEGTSVEALRLLARAHGLKLGAYLDVLANARDEKAISAPAA